MHVLFVEVDTEHGWAVASMGPAFLAAYLRAHGHEASFLRLRPQMGVEDLHAVIEERAVGLVGFSLTTRQWLRARDLAAALRERSPVPVVAGGLHPTFSPDEVLRSPGFDYVCLGEGEEALLELVEALEQYLAPPAIANIQREPACRPPLRAPFSPLDSMPFLARDLLDEYQGVVHMATQRGCPYPCTYCAARMYNQLYGETGSDYGRRRSVGNVMEELHQLKDAGRLAYAVFLDDTFTIQHDWVKDFCRVYGDEIGLPFALHARVETVNPVLLEQLAAAGCHQITYGVESGSERIRREVMKRPVGNQRFVDVFRWTREAGIGLTANFMLGLPEETRDDLQMTLDLAEDLDVLDFGYFVFYPYPGTALFQQVRERGYLPEDYLERPANHRESVLNLPSLTRDDIREYYDRFTALRRRLYLAHLGFDPSEAQIAGASEHVDALARVG